MSVKTLSGKTRQIGDISLTEIINGRERID